jgi:hypothetical protein
MIEKLRTLIGGGPAPQLTVESVEIAASTGNEDAAGMYVESPHPAGTVLITLRGSLVSTGREAGLTDPQVAGCAGGEEWVTGPLTIERPALTGDPPTLLLPADQPRLFEARAALPPDVGEFLRDLDELHLAARLDGRRDVTWLLARRSDDAFVPPADPVRPAKREP